ncbi:MAG: MBL fold metallo-hydrolase, partial [Myxococcota bacterium]
ASNPDTQKLGPSLRTSRAVVDVIASPGHCAGHVSLYDRDERILFAGDSYLQADFTSPNGEVDAEAWIETLERYRRLDIETMVGSHGVVFSVDPRVSHRPFVTSRRDPKALIERKYQFLRWATARVRLAESMGLPYRVIEASLFPWSQPWSGQNWFIDETIRLFSGGEFSRTHFLRSLTRQRDRVPARFPYWARIGRWVAQRLSSLRTMTPSSSANSRSPGVKTTL